MSGEYFSVEFDKAKQNFPELNDVVAEAERLLDRTDIDLDVHDKERLEDLFKAMVQFARNNKDYRDEFVQSCLAEMQEIKSRYDKPKANAASA